MINYLSPDYRDTPARRTLPRIYVRGIAAVEQIDVSIITPYFNTGAIFLETLAALQLQSLQNWEWVIVDDGSTDPDSVERLAKVAEGDSRIKLIQQANAGPSAARNRAFRSASGRYVCLLDSDDMIEPTYLEKCVWFLDSNPEFSFCNSASVIFGDQEYLWANGFEKGREYLQANVSPINSVIRHAAYADCGGFDESIRIGHEDWDFWLSMAQAGHWGYTIPEYLQWIRKRSNGRYEQIMRSGSVNDEFEKSMHRKYDGLEKHFPEPSRRQSKPYETVETTALVTNPLAANSTGRRIMFIVPWMVTGGANRVNLDLIEGLTGKGHDVTVCATLLADHRWEHEFSRFTPDIFILPNILHASDYPRFLAYLIKSRQIDTVVITGSTIGYQLLPYLRAVSPGVAFVDMCQVEEPRWADGGHLRFAVGYQDALDLNIVTTKSLAGWMQGRGADDARIKVMYPGIPSGSATPGTDVREQVRVELGIAKHVPVIVFTGRMCEHERPAMLADILRALRDLGLEFQALVIGDGELRGQFEELLGQYRLNANVQMLGSVSYQRWLDILVVSDILLMPFEYEGISIALLEAMAAGVVPVVAKVDGQDEILSQEAGMLIPHGHNELQAYLNAIERLLSDATVLLAMSKQCKAVAASKLSLQGMIDKFLSILDEAHYLRVAMPRNPISPGLGREFASLALECRRLGEVVHPNAQWNALKSELLAKNAYLEEVLAGKDWLESQWKALQAELIVQQAQLSEVLQSNERLDSQLREQSAQLVRLQSAFPVRALRKIGAISDV